MHRSSGKGPKGRGGPVRCSLSLGLAALLALAATPAHADQSAQLLLTGTVPSKCSLDIGAGGSANFADLTQGASGAFLATVNEKCQHPPYQVTLQTVNGATGQRGGGAEFRQIGNTADFLAYSLTYGGTPVSFDASGLAIVTRSTTKTLGHGIDRDVTVSFAANRDLAAGSYSDTLIVAISAN
jgi:spore coat protein U-like protein